jgi:hypothetical protein
MSTPRQDIPYCLKGIVFGATLLVFGTIQTRQPGHRQAFRALLLADLPSISCQR